MRPGETPPGLPSPSGRGWRATVPVREMAGRLRVAEKLDFQRRTLPYLKVLWPGAVEAPSFGGLDRAGIDHVMFGSGSMILAAIQCKGFSVAEHEIGRDQASQCIKSIRTFRNSGQSANVYLILHNRDNRNPEFTDPVLEELADLSANGRVERTGLWSRNDLLEHAGEAVYERVAHAVRQATNDSVDTMTVIRDGIVLNEVPVQEQSAIVSSTGLELGPPTQTSIRDPAELLLGGHSSLEILLGGFGFGKTTSVLRAASKARRNLVVLPAARLPRDLSSSRQLLALILDSERFSLLYPEVDLDELGPLVQVAVQRLFSSPQSDLALVIDGLDEAPLAARRGGTAMLFTSLKDLRVPLIETMRTEFWLAKQLELTTAIPLANPDRADGRRGE